MSVSITAGIPAWVYDGQNIELLNKTTLANDTTESYSLTGIESGYKMFIISVKVKQVAANNTLNFRLNNDSGNNYFSGFLCSAGTGSETTTAFRIGLTNINFPETTGFSGGVAFIENTTSSAHKTFSMVGGNLGNGSFVQSGTYLSDTEISRIDIYGNTAGRPFKAGTEFIIWGVK